MFSPTSFEDQTHIDVVLSMLEPAKHGTIKSQIVAAVVPGDE
jgi:hypothetical protein